MDRIAIDLKSFLLIWQFVIREGIEIPRSVNCQTSGGSRLKMHKNLKFNADTEYQITIPIHYFDVLWFKMRKPLGVLTVQRIPLSEDLGEWNDEAGSFEKRTWKYNMLFGFILLSVTG